MMKVWNLISFELNSVLFAFFFSSQIYCLSLLPMAGCYLPYLDWLPKVGKSEQSEVRIFIS